METQPNHILATARQLHDRGYVPVPVPAGGKKPVMFEWQKFRPTADELPAHFNGVGNVGVLLGAPSQGLVDVDLDCPEALELADQYLPPTPVTTGRTSTPRSHRWYIAVGAKTVQHKDPASREMLVELRSTGTQTLVGPSIHPETGEPYDMLTGEPAVVDAANLAACVVALAAEIVRRRHPHLPPPTAPTMPSGPTSPRRAHISATSGEDGRVLRRAEAYLDKIPGAISGQGGHSQTFTAAVAMVHGFCLAPDLAFDLLWTKYNPRCVPPWTEKELWHKVKDAVGKPHDKPRGWLRDEPMNSCVHGEQTFCEDQSPAESRALHRTDLGNAERLANSFSDLLRFCHPTAQWFVWDGARWKEDDEGAPLRCAARTARDMLRHAAEIPRREEREAFAKWALASESRTRLEGMAEVAKSCPELCIRVRDMDADPWLLNVANGTIDLKTGQLRPHHRDDLITKLAPVQYDPKAMCPRFLTFLDRIFAGDADLIAYVQRMLGHCLRARQQITRINVERDGWSSSSHRGTRWG